MSINTSRTVLYRNDKCCSDYTDNTCLDLKKLCQTDHKESAPTSYSHKTTNTKEADLFTGEKENDNLQKIRVDTIAQTGTNKSSREKKDHILEQSQYRTRCYQCKDLVQRIRSLLDEIKAIRKNVTTTVICDFCKCVSASANCKRCEFLAGRYKISENIDDVARQQRFKIWLSKVKQFLYTILERETCKHKVYPKTAASDELTNLLHELKSPLTIREPKIGYFPSIDSLENITESKDILEEVLMRLKSEKRSEEYMFRTSCVCKYFADKKFVEIVPEEKEISVEGAVPPPTLQDGETDTDIKAKRRPGPKNELKPSYSNKLKGEIKPKDMGLKKTKDKYSSKEKLFQDKQVKEKDKKLTLKTAEKKSLSKPLRKEKLASKSKLTSEEDMMIRLLKQGVNKKETKSAKVEKPLLLPKIDELPTPRRKVKKSKELVENMCISESVMECDAEDQNITEMVKEAKIVPIEPRKALESSSVQPIMFKVAPECSDDQKLAQTSTEISDKTKSMKSKGETTEQMGKGILKYTLSNREFIEKGWTQLPTTKIMRRMNIYKMVPANPQFDWFERHKIQRTIHYGSGEKLAEIEEDGSGKWFYKNGSLALDYYCDQESNVGHRYVVYSSGEDTDAGKKLPVTVLAFFDYQGNGVVYDNYGNERIKYNQSEGIVFDEKIGPPSRWKWHSLNEPPVLQPVFVDAHVRPNSCLQRFLRTRKDDDKSDADSKHKKEPNIEMLTIELENFMKEKADKLLQEFKPFQIKMKALKVNDQFSLKVLDQASIYLLFREGHTCIKLNLGMLLMSNEIIDTDTAEVSQVATPCDRYPPKSQSIADIQIALERARKLGKARGKLRN